MQFSADLIGEITQIRKGSELKPCALLVGPIGSGKSSLVNTLLSSGSSDLVHKAGTGTDVSSLTTRFTRYDGMEKLRNVFRVCDTTGILGVTDRGIRSSDLHSVINGHVASGYKFQEDKDIADDDPQYVKKPENQDKSHCMVIVLSSTQVQNGISQEFTKKVMDAVHAAREKDIRSMIVLTKLDLICGNVEKNMTKVFNCPHVKSVVKKTSEMFGIPEGLIFPLINYSAERSKYESEAVDILALLALRRMVKLSCDYMEGNELD